MVAQNNVSISAAEELIKQLNGGAKIEHLKMLVSLANDCQEKNFRFEVSGEFSSPWPGDYRPKKETISASNLEFREHEGSIILKCLDYGSSSYREFNLADCSSFQSIKNSEISF